MARIGTAMKKRTLVLGAVCGARGSGRRCVYPRRLWFPQGAVAQAPGGGPRAVPVEIAKAEKKSVPLRVEALGTVTPIRVVAIKARLETVITEVHFADGAEVKEGDLLFTLDSRQIEAEIKRVEAVITGALAQLQQAERDVQRYTELVAKNATTVVTLNNAQTQVNMSRATARVEQATLENLKVQLDYTKIRAPFSGRISAANVKAGNFVRPSDTGPAGHPHSDGPGLRDLHGAAADAARRAPGRRRRESDGRGDHSGRAAARERAGHDVSIRRSIPRPEWLQFGQPCRTRTSCCGRERW